MNKQKKNFLTPNQFGLFILGFSVGPAFLKLPNVLVETGGQDAWIVACIALIYPLYVVLIGNYIINNHPKENILILSKKYFGGFLGSILNFIFMLQFILYTSTVTTDLIELTTTYIVDFLNPIKITIIAISLAAYAASKGIKVLGKVNEIITYSFVLLIFTISAMKYGSVLNVRPVLGTGILNIIKSSIKTVYIYTSWEAILLFFPYVEDTKAIKKSVLKALGLAGTIWIWTVFATIFYLGIDIIPKSYWSFIVVFESIHIPIINNFRYVFMFSWVLIVFRMIANYYFATAFILNDFIKMDVKKIVVLIYPFIVYLTFKLSNNVLRKNILSVTTPIFVIFNLIFITLIALFILVKSKLSVNCEQSN